MAKRQEKNILVFNLDVSETGQYIYTNKKMYSAFIANKRQSDEIVRMLKRYIRKGSLLDVGCGDGTYTLELFKRLSLSSITGFDPAEQAITAARNKIQPKDKEKITFSVADIYDVDRMYKKRHFDVAVIRGVLHHLYDPQFAIEKVSKIADNVIVLEPNGYNPILKIIEKTSPYHREHEEKSYWPPTLDRWFISNGYHVKARKFFCIVPYFCPTIVAKTLAVLEPFFESFPLIKNLYCGTNLILYSKK